MKRQFFFCAWILLGIFGAIFFGFRFESSMDSMVSTSNTPQSAAIMKEFYISPTGNDTYEGNFTHPFQTIIKAQNATRALIPGMTGDIIVNFRAGMYTLSTEWLMNQSDSGQNGYLVTYRSYENDAIIISGGRQLVNWLQRPEGIWTTQSSVADFRQLYVNGERMVRARGDPTMIASSDGDGHKLSNVSMGSWKNLQDVEIVYRDIWTMPRIHVNAYNKDQEKIYMQQPAYGAGRTKGGTHITEPTWIENALELLDEPGEWYLNRHNGTVYYLPRTDQNMETAQIMVPAIQTVLGIDGNESTKVQNLRFQGLSFQYGTWLEPNRYGVGFVDLQANVFFTVSDNYLVGKMSPGNVRMTYAQNIRMENCSIMHMGTGALEIGAGVNTTSIIGNKICDISGIGVQIGEVSYPLLNPDHPQVVRDIAIMNNYITNGSLEYRGGPGIFTGYVRNVRIEHNTISNICYTGISVGWGWSPTLTVCANNTVLFNRIYGVMNYLTDGAGIYTLSTQPGLNVSYNVIYDSGWNGLYPDERTNASTWQFNVVWNCFNSYQNHIMYFNEMDDPWYLNNISNNYFDSYPDFAIPIHWEGSSEDKAQFWGIKSGDPDFPQWIVDLSGVEPQYASLVPANEWHWTYQVRYLEINPLGTNIFWVYGITAIFIVITVIGVIIITKMKSQMLPIDPIPTSENQGGEQK